MACVNPNGAAGWLAERGAPAKVIRKPQIKIPQLLNIIHSSNSHDYGIVSLNYFFRDLFRLNGDEIPIIKNRSRLRLISVISRDQFFMIEISSPFKRNKSRKN